MNFLRSNRVALKGVVARVLSMNKVGIKTSNIMSHIALQSGGYENVHFQLKYVYNKVFEQRRTYGSETDAEGALGYFDAATRSDPFLFVDFQVDEENRRDHAAFGDVPGFDMTYRTNKYNKPLIILLRVNNHFDIAFLGSVYSFMRRETNFIGCCRSPSNV
ncbi:protein FAR-RED ELONGATED HYPOCOTYL 3-like [Humulus lupulus]|uniref:protein FAR-RED ELONGATED HYPOCOTYL 3-like n=1 Tax=Humulus lupulus TaxID=3486 RepID=UPI002B414CDF|nr:protein FAR-RED ELONGATED HYPOCOTYL 3-like [Humulus lupulus]